MGELAGARGRRCKPGARAGGLQPPAAQEACQHFLGSDEHGTPAQEAQDGAKLLSYAKCMRSHGITNFPDPVRHADGGYGFVYTDQLDQSSPAYLAANQACRSLLPGDHHEGGGS